MKNTRGLRIAIWVVCFLPLLITLLLYARLPQSIPMHWGIAGEADAWGPRAGAFGTAALSVGMLLLFELMPRLDPKRKNYEKFTGAYRVLFLAIACFLLFMQCITLYSALYPAALNVPRIVAGITGLLLCVSGNFMPKFRHNYFCGIRTPWTLASEECWRRTHRFGGVVWVLCGAGIIVISLFLSGFALYVALAGIMLGMVLLCCAYSYWVYCKTEKPE